MNEISEAAANLLDYIWTPYRPRAGYGSRNARTVADVERAFGEYGTVLLAELRRAKLITYFGPTERLRVKIRPTAN